MLTDKTISKKFSYVDNLLLNVRVLKLSKNKIIERF